MERAPEHWTKPNTSPPFLPRRCEMSLSGKRSRIVAEHRRRRRALKGISAAFELGAVRLLLNHYFHFFLVAFADAAGA